MEDRKNIPKDLNYRYYAFISYSRKDKKWVDWLQKNIEHYKIPTVLRDEYSNLGKSLPKFVRPIFRDTTDITPKGGLALTLQQELEQSKYLIVVCSPSSAKPNADGTHWVNDEIIEFQKMGRNNHIIPFIVEGNPESPDPAIQCYPPALLELDDKPLGICMHEDAKPTSFLRKILRFVGLDVAANNALLKVVAVLLNVYYDELKRRHQVRERKRNAIMAMLLLFCMAFGFWVYDKNYRIKTYYYTDYIYRYGVPEGVFPLDVGEMQARSEHYRLIYKGGKLLELRYVNSSNKLLKHPTGLTLSPSKALFSDYDEENRPRSTQYYNEKNEETMYLSWTRDRKAVDFKRAKSQDSASPMALSASMAAQLDAVEANKRSAIIRYKFEYDDVGFATKQWFMSSAYDNSNTSDANGIFGYIFEKNPYNIATKQSYMDFDGSAMSIKNGTSSIGYEYDEKGRLSSISFFDKNGNLLLQNENYAKVIKNYNEDGNVIEESFLGADNKPILTVDGYAKLKQKFDARGNVIEQVYLGINDELVLYNGVAKLKQKFDKRGSIIEQEYFDINDKPVLNDDGIAKLTQRYDDQLNIREQVFLGINNELILNKEGIAKLTQKFDEKGNKIEEAYFGINNEPILNKEGIAKITQLFSDDLSYKEQAYFGVNDEPILYNGYAKLRKKFDSRGNVTEEAFFGKNDELVLNDQGIARVVQTFDVRGYELREAYFGTNNEPILNKDGYAQITRKFDVMGNLLKETYFGINGEPVSGKNGHSKTMQKSD